MAMTEEEKVLNRANAKAYRKFDKALDPAAKTHRAAVITLEEARVAIDDAYLSVSAPLRAVLRAELDEARRVYDQKGTVNG